MSEDNADIAVIKTLLSVQADTSKRIEENFREWRQENREAISAIRSDFEKEMGHQKRNSDTQFAAVERVLASKADQSDLDENQRLSNERFTDVKTWLDQKADKLTQTIVFGFCGLILVAFGGVWIADYVHDRQDKPAANAQPHTPIAPTTQAR